MAMGEDKIIEAFENHFPNIDNLADLDRPGQKIKFQFQDKWYEVDADVNMIVFYASPYLTELKKRAVGAVLGRKEFYPSGPEKEEKSQEYKEKLFYASCRAMQGLTESTINHFGTAVNLRDKITSESISYAKDLLEKLDIK